ncbi:MAG: hypothetical protein CMO98_13160 [Woeseia sp.]|nr:hypothetical protein [Woeseia sp.]|tara:strand:- start:3556 stop:4215 length:660 start_codon:yes stop_codon:yes gene_type:complete
MARQPIKWDHSGPDITNQDLRMSEKSVNHNELEILLSRCGSRRNPGEVHGLLCSCLAVAGIDGAGEWLVQVLEATDPNSAARAECELMLDDLYATTWRQLVERQSEFQLLLPDDMDSTAARAEAMGRWCEGFLNGLISHKKSEELKDRLVAEPLADIISDIVEIARATTDEDAEAEEEENAYTELVEYLRVAAQLAYEELAEFRSLTENQLFEKPEHLH